MGEKDPEKRKLIEKVKQFKESEKFEKIIIFGSFARGDFGEESDVDLIILDERFEGKDPIERSKGLWIEWHLKQKVGKPVDFICYTPEEFDRLKKGVSLASEALKEGIVV